MAADLPAEAVTLTEMCDRTPSFVVNGPKYTGAFPRKRLTQLREAFPRERQVPGRYTAIRLSIRESKLASEPIRPQLTIQS
jgi:hypothetical protein